LIEIELNVARAVTGAAAWAIAIRISPHDGLVDLHGNADDF
jgi:hypothetical protein